uniref:NAD-dependent epimerase/dehydratase domain-containing protein n=1 Tax=Chrysotila carterae TaxID=13221 RepID=A0A7S4B2I5_CHRCT
MDVPSLIWCSCSTHLLCLLFFLRLLFSVLAVLHLLGSLSRWLPSLSKLWFHRCPYPAMSESKCVCIVGVAGFIGSHMLEKIIRERDWTVLGCDMVAPTKIQELLGAEKKWAARFEFHQMNIVEEPQKLKALIARADCVVNLAAICNPSEYIKQPVNTINSNFTDAQDCINYCVELKKHLIHFSTCEVYGRTLSSYGLDAKDEKNWLLDEETTPMIMGPVSAQRWCYACAKQLVERLIFAHGTENGLKFTIVRPYNWIGPRMDYIPGVDGKDDGQPRVLASFMTALMKGEPLVLVNGGEVFRTFCFVEDACDAVMRMIEHPDKSSGHAFNVGNPNNNIQISKLAELMINMYSKITGKPKGTTVSISGEEYYGKGYEDSDLRIPSMKLVKKQLDWTPPTSLETAMEATMRVFIEKYSDKLANLKRSADEAAAAPAKKAK